MKNRKIKVQSTSNTKNNSNICGFAHVIFLLVVVIAVIGGVGYLMFQNGQLKTTLTKSPPSNNNTDSSPASWQQYSNEEYGFSFSYPSIWATEKEVETTNQLLRLNTGISSGQRIGPIDPGEIVNYSLIVNVINTSSITDWVKDVTDSGGGNILLDETTIGGGDAYKTQDIPGMLSQLDYFVQLNPETYLNIEVWPYPTQNPDIPPENRRTYQNVDKLDKIIDQVLSTFEFTGDSNSILGSVFNAEIPAEWKIESIDGKTLRLTTIRETDQTATGDYTPGMAWMSFLLLDETLDDVLERYPTTRETTYLDGIEATRVTGSEGVAGSVFYDVVITTHEDRVFLAKISTQDDNLKTEFISEFDQVLSSLKFIK